MYRIEDKYILSLEDRVSCEKRISTMLILDCYSQGGGYTVTSLYFDDWQIC